MSEAPSTRRQREVHDLYLSGMPIADIAAKLRTSKSTVKVIAHRLGLKREPGHRVEMLRKSFDRKRGFRIPPSKREDYDTLLRAGYRAQEAGRTLGLLP